MLRWPGEWKQVIRYYQVGIVNTVFGYGLFALFVAIGLNMFLAQVISHILGIIFNYLTYSNYAFTSRPGSRLRFLASYIGNYFLSVVILALVATAVPSPYAAGLISTVLVSVINYFVLKRLVFADNVA